MPQLITFILVLLFALNASAFGQTIKTASSPSVVTLKALSYFERLQDQQFDDYLRRIRPVELDPGLRVRVLNVLPKDDLVIPSTEGLVKFKVLEPVLKYHDRDSIIELKVLRAPTATAVFLAGAAVLITEPALKILSAEELQAVVAHELGHEYYWNRFEHARQNHDHTEMQELELRCDGIAAVTLRGVGVDPENLISAITKLNKHNERLGSPSSQNYVALKERTAFIRSMVELLRARGRTQAVSGEKGETSQPISLSGSFPPASGPGQTDRPAKTERTGRRVKR